MTEVGKNQSPIALCTQQSTRAILKKWERVGKGWGAQEAVLKNVGDTVQVEYTKDTKRMILTGAGLEDIYVFEHIQFHWDSEHTMDSKRYPLEAHLTFFAEKYVTIQEAMTHNKGVAVLGVFYELDSEGNPAFDSIIGKIKDVEQSINKPVKLNNPINVNDFLPYDQCKFFRYEGSLTTFHSSETVVWSVFTTPSQISQRQFNALTKISDEGGRPVSQNRREIQPRHGREVILAIAKNY